MALPHADPWQPISVAPLGAALADTPSHALLKTHSLELIRLVLRGGEGVPPHSVYGEVTLHCLEGEVVVEGEGAQCRLRAQQVVLLPACTRFTMRSDAGASLLMTVHTPPGKPGSGSATTGA